MSSVSLFIKENIQDMVTSDFEVYPNIPQKKLDNAISSFCCHDSENSILALYDSTRWGSGKEGILLTGEKFYCGNSSEIYYEDIESVVYSNEDEEELIIKFKGCDNDTLEKNSDKIVPGTSYTFGMFAGRVESNEDTCYPPRGFLYLEEFADFLSKIVTDFDEYNEVKTLLIISDMSEEFKITYLKTIVNMTFFDDHKIDEKELAEIYSLMNRIELDDESRFTIRAYLSEISEENFTSNVKLIEELSTLTDPVMFNSIMLSLTKDLINVFLSSKEKGLVESYVEDILYIDGDDLDFYEHEIDSILEKIEFTFLNDNKNLIQLSNKEIFLCYSTFARDFNIINKELDNDQIKDSMKDLSAQALAIGAPLGAVYLSGSVLGLSAAGMTSGLAALGLGGILGLSSMATGVGTAVLLGVGIYKSIKYLSGSSNAEKFSVREQFLRETINEKQKTISYLIKDMNYQIRKLNNLKFELNEVNLENDDLHTVIETLERDLETVTYELALDNKAANHINYKMEENQHAIEEIHS